MQRLLSCNGGGRRRPWRRREAGNGGSGTCSAQLEVEEADWSSWAKKVDWAEILLHKLGRTGMGCQLLMGQNVGRNRKNTFEYLAATFGLIQIDFEFK
jgi:hypothetical protein